MELEVTPDLNMKSIKFIQCHDNKPMTIVILSWE